MTTGESEKIVIVDDHDEVVGEEEKEKCHEGNGLLHRGFLVMVFNTTGELLLARRSEKKRLWPGFWDGSVASHVFKDENYTQASERRLRQELGLSVSEIEYAFKFRYKAQYRDVGTEQEICAVTIVRGVEHDLIHPNSGEIAEVRFSDLKKLIDDVRADGNPYTPWLLLALEHMSERPLTPRAELLRQTMPC